MDNIVSVSVLVFRDENILFIKSAGKNGFRLTLPGGKLRGSESIEECAIREVMESAGVKIVLDKKMSGIITRRNKQGNFLVTFVFLAETNEDPLQGKAGYIPYNNVKYYREVSEFSKLIIEKLKVSSLSGMDKSELKTGDGREYLMYF